MRKKIFIVSIITLTVAAFCADAFAGLIDWERRNRYLKERQMDESQDSGTVKEMTKDDLPQWMKEEPKVRTRDERRYDVNRDGYFQPAESKVYLRRLLVTIEKKGKITSRSDLLKEYDVNSDGVLTKTEAKKIRRDVL
ncbi:MAG: hypothetical protein P9M07_03390 [Candidatus Aceula meridiana]|nr:hypothetical protein [Candidatus Aceula meridiana]